MRAALCSIGLVATTPGAGMAADGFGFSQSGASVAIATMSTAVPDIVRAVTVQCPAKGKLWANATGRLSFEAWHPNFAGTVVYALSRNSTAMQPDFQHNIYGFVDQFVLMPMSIQRVDNCNKNQNVTYRLLATKGTFSADYVVAKPALVVSFEPD
jgi:hypothetical protein